METLAKLFTEYETATVLVLFIMFCLAIKGVIEFILWIKDKLEKYRQQKNEPEKKEEHLLDRMTELEKRIDTLEERDKSQGDELSAINKKLDDMVAFSKQQTIIMTRSGLLTIYKSVSKRGTIYPDEYETFSGLAEMYVQSGGNSLFKDRIIPEVKSMEVVKD